MAAARIAACTAAARFSFADEPAPPETLDVVRRQRQLLHRAAALCLDPIAEETDDVQVYSASESDDVPPSFGRRIRNNPATCVSGRPWASSTPCPSAAAAALRI